jgi:hypothetical protein
MNTFNASGFCLNKPVEASENSRTPEHQWINYAMKLLHLQRA